MLATAFQFLDIPRFFALIDHELELVEPDARYVDELLAACHHPATRDGMPQQAKTQRSDVVTFLTQNPRGQTLADPARQVEPGYTFWMRLRQGVPPLPSPSPAPDLAIVGSISLRIGHTLNLDRYLGHIGYHVMPSARGHHYSERAARLLLPIARAHGHQHIWITCNPDNLPSRRTCERLGAAFVDTVALPRDNALYTQGDRQKCRYRLEL
jgi:RimJ/RimL family protein N-acetyltransferase